MGNTGTSTSAKSASPLPRATPFDMGVPIATAELAVPVVDGMACATPAAWRERTPQEQREADSQKGRGSTHVGVDEKRVRDRSRDLAYVRVTNSFWPELEGLYVPKGGSSWDGMPLWTLLTAEEEAKQCVDDKSEGGRFGIWWRNEGHWRMGRRNHYFHIADSGKSEGNIADYPPATDEGAIWESAHGFYTKKGDRQAADKLCEKGHPDWGATVQVTWEYPFGHPKRTGSKLM
ncbi:hypothetical protein TrST_g9609 [Triparma strigata]|uniref:Uncharacterized protein n=1 Tax=Triparma strigata TaxID=1606541 RepID=A0A9W6ZS26_9STRA|nr:hypothetical protein TrST_g9609 [Triparma strigata]